MAAPLRTPKEAWIEAGLRALADGGPAAVRVEPLARLLGVSKGGFYGHFAGRRALLDEMLDRWERRVADQAIEHVEAGGGDGRAKLQRLFGLAGSSEGGGILEIDLAVRDWARRDKRVERRLRHVDNRRMDFLREQFREFCRDEDDVEVRSTLVVSLWLGNHFMAADHGRRSRARVLALALERILEEPSRVAFRHPRNPPLEPE